MTRWLLIAVALLAGCDRAGPQAVAPTVVASLEGPESVPGGGFAVYYDITEGARVAWANEYPKGAMPPARVTDENGRKMLAFFNTVPGVYRFGLSAQLSVDKSDGYDPIASDSLETVVGTPAPPVVVPPVVTPPGPVEPGPVTPVPLPAGHVLIVTEESSGECDAWLPVLNSLSLRAWLDARKVKWRILDKETNMANADAVWQEAMKIPRQSVPWLIASNGTTGYSGPLPKTEAEALALLGRYFP